MMKQGVAAAIGVLVMWLLMHFDYRLFGRKVVIWSLFGFTVALLLLAVLRRDHFRQLVHALVSSQVPGEGGSG